jgi:hypothetical protein
MTSSSAELLPFVPALGARAPTARLNQPSTARPYMRPRFPNTVESLTSENGVRCQGKSTPVTSFFAWVIVRPILSGLSTYSTAVARFRSLTLSTRVEGPPLALLP